jgi:hypothetical protein
VLLRHAAAGSRAEEPSEMLAIPAEIESMSYVSDDRN